jgi:hypothetical protein
LLRLLLLLLLRSRRRLHQDAVAVSAQLLRLGLGNNVIDRAAVAAEDLVAARGVGPGRALLVHRVLVARIPILPAPGRRALRMRALLVLLLLLLLLLLLRLAFILLRELTCQRLVTSLLIDLGLGLDAAHVSLFFTCTHFINKEKIARCQLPTPNTGAVGQLMGV